MPAWVGSRPSLSFLGGSRGWLSRVPAAHMGDEGGVPGFWLQPRPDLAIVAGTRYSLVPVLLVSLVVGSVSVFWAGVGLVHSVSVFARVSERC